MKLRYGFVSNSSSSSFICDICGNVEEVYDDADGWSQCEEGHTWEDNCFKIDSEVESEKCPICSMKYFTDSDLMSYLITKTGKARIQIEDEIRKEFANYDLFMVYLKRGEK